MANYISIIATSLVQPLYDHLEALFPSPPDSARPLPHHNEVGYSASVCLLFAVITESFLMRARYLDNESPGAKQRSLHRFIRDTYPELPNPSHLAEVFVLRDLIAHNHLWVIESSSEENIWDDLLTSRLHDLSSSWTDIKYKDHVDIATRTTRQLHLHVIPTQVVRKDALAVVHAVVPVLRYIDDQHHGNLGIHGTIGEFRGQHVSLPDLLDLLPLNQTGT